MPLGGKLAAVCAAIITFQTVLIMGGGFGWAVAGLLGLSGRWVWAGGGLAFLLALVSGIWLLRKAWRVEQDLVDAPSEEAEGSPVEGGGLEAF